MIKKTVNYFCYFIYFVCFYLVRFLVFFVCFFNKNKKYVFLERKNEAQDNAYYMYLFFKEKGYSNLKYIINKKSSDARKICKDDLVNYGGFFHLFYIHFAKAIISTHCETFINTKCSKTKLFKTKAKIIFLQHGIIKNDHPQLHFGKKQIDLFISGAKLEYDFLIKNFDYPQGYIKWTGLARYDFLFPYSIKNRAITTITKILIMPTWRMWLSEDNVMESDFLLQWKEFICSKEVKNMCAESGVTFVFLPHPEFKSFKNYPFINEEHVLVADLNDKNIQSYLIDADLLITDYSSVYFDFAFMNKPVIYYQFDETDYYSKHYLKGYFDYDTMGFGPKFTKPSEVITYLQKLLKKSINLDVYAKRCDKFFLLKDNNNRERNYYAIMETINDEKQKNSKASRK